MFCGVRMKAFSNILSKPLIHLLILFFFVSMLNSTKVSFAATNQPLPELRIVYLPKHDILDDAYEPEAHLNARLQILSKYFDNKFTLVSRSFEPSAAVKMLDSGEANIIGFLFKTPERAFRMKFTKRPAFKTSLYIVCDEDKEIFYGDTKALSGKDIAIFAGNSLEKATLEDYLIENNISMNYVMYDSHEEYMRSDADFHLSNALYFIKGKQIVMRVGQQDFYFATLPKYAHLLDILDDAMAKADKFDVVALRDIKNKYITKSIKGLHRNLSIEEMTAVQTPSKIFQLAYAADHYPIQYKDEQGKASGIAQGVHLLFKQMHDTPNRLVPYDMDSSVDLSKFDMLFSIVGQKDIREKYFNASNTYANLPMVLFKPKKKVSAVNEFVGVLDYTVLDLKDVRGHFPHCNIQVFGSLDKLFTDYELGKIDVMLLSYPEAEYAFSQLGKSKNTIVPTSLVLPLKFYTSKSLTNQALTVLNAFIAKLNPIAVQEVILKAESEVHAPSTLEGIYRNYKGTIIGSVAAILFVLLCLHFLRLYLQKQKFYKLSLTDSLTGLSTKESAYATMQQALSNALPDEYIVFCTDIDKFTLLNQVYGRDKGDAILIYLANYFKKKYAENYKAECVARLGDDLFLVFGKTKLLLEALEVSGEVLPIVHELEEILQSSYNVGMSKGCYIIDDVTLPIETIVDYCQMARRSCKHEQGLSTAFFDEDMKQTIERRKDIIYKIENSLNKDEFVLFFQPKIDLTKEQICGAEVLVRWQTASGPVLLADDFISTLESNAFITRLDLYMIEKTCQFIQGNRNKFRMPPLSLNLSGITILHVDSYMHITNIMQHYDISPSEIEFEITENSMMIDNDTFVKRIDTLCKAGLTIAIDDFGTGISSLHRLSTLCVHTIKLDKAFLDEKFSTKNGLLVVASIITMLRRLGIQVVAEGVETKLHADILKKLLCDMAQGNYFYKPLTMQDFTDLLEESKT